MDLHFFARQNHASLLCSWPGGKFTLEKSSWGLAGKTVSSFEKQTCEVPAFFQFVLNLCVLHLLEPKVNTHMVCVLTVTSFPVF